MPHARKNSTGRSNQSGAASSHKSPITKEQKLKLNSEKADRLKLLSEIYSPIATGTSFLANFSFMIISNALVKWYTALPEEMEVYFDLIDMNEKESLKTFKLTIDLLMPYLNHLSINKLDPDFSQAHDNSHTDIIEFFRVYGACNYEDLNQNITHLYPLEITELYSKMLAKRMACIETRTALENRKKHAPQFSAFLSAFFTLSFKYLWIDPNLKQLCGKYLQEDIDKRIASTKEEADALIRDFQIANNKLEILANRNRIILMIVAVIAAPLITYKIYISETIASELLMFAFYCYMTILSNAAKAGYTIWQHHRLQSSFERRKQFLSDITSNDYTTIIEHIGQKLETSFITLKIDSYKQLKATLVSQIIKNELMKQGIKIEHYKADTIIIRADIKLPASSEKLKNTIADRLEKQNESILFSKQISRLAVEIFHEVNGQLNTQIDETAIPEMNNGNPFYSCYLKVPIMYRSALNMDSLQRLFPKASIEFFEEDDVFKIYGAKSANEDEMRNTIDSLKQITNEYKKRMENATFFIIQADGLAKRCTNIPLKSKLMYDENGFPVYKCYLMVPEEFKAIINTNSLKAMFPSAEIHSKHDGFKLVSTQPGINEDIEIIYQKLTELKQKQTVQAQVALQLPTKKPKEKNNNNNATPTNKNTKKLDIIDFGDGVTYNPNIPDGCQFVQTASDPTKMDIESFIKSAYVLFNNALYYVDRLDDTCVPIAISESALEALKNNLDLKENQSLEQAVHVFKELSRKQLKTITNITNHEHHKSEVVPFCDSQTSLPKNTFFCRRLSKVMTPDTFIKAGYDKSNAQEAFDAFDEMTDYINKANGRQGAAGVVFEQEEVKVKSPGAPTVTVNADAKIKRLGKHGDERLWLFRSASKGPDNRKVLYTPIVVKPHAH